MYFVDLANNGHNLQIKLDKRDVESVEDNTLGPDLNRGDIIGLEGTPGKTRSGELSLFASHCHLLSK